MTHADHMREAIGLAEQAKGFTSPNPCVGAVVVNNGRIVGRGFHRAAGLPHAEVEAINEAGRRTVGATIYVTLEPCNHFGKTPPCTQQIIKAGITRVVVGCKDPNPFVTGNGIQHLRETGITVETGVLEKECRVLIEDFIWYVQHDKHPFVILKCAATLDGRIATSSGDSKWITGESARDYGHRIRHEVDGILIGSGTLHADNPSLTARVAGKQTKDPARIILDTHLSISDQARVFHLDSKAKNIVVHGPGVPEKRKSRIKDQGAILIETAIRGPGLDLNELMIRLGQMSLLSVLIEGGGTVSGAALKAGIVNKMLYFLAPKFLGGSDGVPVFKGAGPDLIKDAFSLKEMDVLRLDNDLLIQGYLK